MPDVAAVFNAVDNISHVARGIGDNIALMSGVVGQTLSGVGGRIGDLGNAMQILATGPLGIVEAGISTTINAMEEMSSAMAGVSARTGLTGDALKQLRQDATNITNTGLVENFDQAARLSERVRTAIKGFSDDQSLQKFEVDVAGVAKAWGTSSDTVIRDVHNIQTEFKGIYEDPVRALDLLTTTAEKSHLPLEKISQIIEKAGPKFSAAGISALGMGALITAGTNAGITNFTALANSLDSFHQKVINPPKSFEAAVKKLGLEDAVTAFRQNKISMDTLLDDVFNKLDSIKDPAARSQAAIELFGKGIDKVGGGDKLAALAGYETTFGKIQGAADKAAQTMEDDGTLGTAIKRLGANIKTGLGEAGQTAYDRLKSLTDNASALWDVLSNNTNGAMDKMKLAVQVAFNDARRDVEQKVADATLAVSNGWNNAKGVIETAVRNVTDTVTTHWNNAKTAVDKTLQLFKQIITTAWNEAKAIVDGVLTGIQTGIQTAWDKAVAIVNAAQKGVSDAFNAIAKVITDALAPVIAFINDIASKIGSIGTGLSAIKGMLGMHAQGGDLDEGWNIVGEEGPEAIYKSGGRASVLTAGETKKMMVAGAGASAGGGTTIHLHISGNTIVGSNGMEQFTRILYKKFQAEDLRRGKRD